MTRWRMLAVACVVACQEAAAPAAQRVRPDLEIVDGANQTAQVTHELATPITARVTDSVSKQPAAGILVNWVVVSGGGTVFAGAALTNDSGLARERWTLGTVAGTQLLEARAVDPETGDPIVFVQVSATATPGPTVTAGWPARDWVIPADQAVTLTPTAADFYGNATAPPAVIGLDLDFPPPASSWSSSRIGYTQFTVTWAGGVDTLGVTIVPPGGTYRLSWAIGGVVYTESGRLVRGAVDTTRTLDLCAIVGTVIYARTDIVATRSDSLGDTLRVSGGHTATADVCAYPDYPGGMRLAPLRYGTGSGWNDFWEAGTSAPGRWAFKAQSTVGDSLVVVTP